MPNDLNIYKTKSQVQNEISVSNTFRNLATSYEQISVLKMENVRGRVTSTRDFAQGLQEVFSNVKTSYELNLIKLAEKKSNKLKTTPQKTLKLLISGNDKLHGDITERVTKLFLENIQNKDDSIAIIGNVGKEEYLATGNKRDFKYFDLSDPKSAKKDLQLLSDYIILFDNVLVFYGKFINVITQEPIMSDISGLNLSTSTSDKEQIEFIFEPNLEENLKYFQTQVLLSLFKQSSNEEELARHASTIQSMELAIQGVDKRHLLLSKRFKRLKELMENKKRLESISGISLWKM